MAWKTNSPFCRPLNGGVKATNITALSGSDGATSEVGIGGQPSICYTKDPNPVLPPPQKKGQQETLGLQIKQNISQKHNPPFCVMKFMFPALSQESRMPKTEFRMGDTCRQKTGALPNIKGELKPK